MGLFGAKSFDNLEDLFCAQLEDLYDAEKRMIEALPKLADSACSPELKSAFQGHLHQTEGHVRRLEQIFRQLGKTPSRETCPAMKGLISEGNEMAHAKGDDDVRDAALIAAAQRVEHYEISGYGTARTFAERLGHTEAARMLQQTLDEEKETDKKLTQIAESSVNVHAAHS